MSKRFLVLFLASVALATVVTPGASFAAGGVHTLSARHGGESGVSLNEAVRQAQGETGGRVLSADTVKQGGRTTHRIKVLTPSGRVRVVVIDAQTRGH